MFGLHNSTTLSDYHLDNETVNNTPPPPYMLQPGQSIMDLQIIVRRLHMFYLPCIYAVGLLGNLISIAALTDAMMNGLATTHYLIGILVVDLLQVLALLHSWLEKIEIDMTVFHIGGWCQFSTFMSYVTRFLSVWYTVFLSLECAVLACFSGKSCYPWKAQMIMIGTAIIAIVVYLNISILYGAIAVGTDRGTRMLCTELYPYKNIHDRLADGDAFVNALIPNCVVIITILCCSKYVKCNCRNDSRNQGLLEIESSGIFDNRNDSRTRRVASESTSPSSQTQSFCSFLVFHVIFYFPLDCFRFVRSMENLSSAEAYQPTLEGFLIDSILQYVKSTKYALNILVLFIAMPPFRCAMTRIKSRFTVCCKQKRRHTTHSVVTTEETILPA